MLFLCLFINYLHGRLIIKVDLKIETIKFLYVYMNLEDLNIEKY